MNKITMKRLVATFAIAAMFIGGAIAQTHDGTAIPGAAADYASGDAQTNFYMTQGATIPVYALPDPYYHPLYNVATSTWTLTDGFVWDWRVTTGTATHLTFSNDSVVAAGSETNYTAITAGGAASGAYTVNVREIAPAAYGGCVDAGKNLTVNVVAEPSFSINGGDATYDFCEGNASLPSNINTTIADGWQNYRLAWSLEIATLDASSAKEFYYDDENGTNPAGAQKYAQEYTTSNGSFQALAAATATHDIMTVGSFLVINNGTRDATTVYTYTLDSINDQALRNGDFITLDGSTADASLFTHIAATAASDQVIVTVYPAPVTGPIYRITNTWAQ